MESRFIVTCECGKRLSVSAKGRGKSVRCPGCDNSIPIPQAQVGEITTSASGSPVPKRGFDTLRFLWTLVGVVAVGSVGFLWWFLNQPTESERQAATVRLEESIEAARDWLEQDGDENGDSIEKDLVSALADRGLQERKEGTATLAEVRRKLAEQRRANGSSSQTATGPDDEFMRLGAAESPNSRQNTELKGKNTMNTEEVVSATISSVVLIKGSRSSGSGFVIDKDLIATNKHVIEGESMNAINAYFPSVSEKRRGPHPVTLLYEDPTKDLAFLKIERAVSSPLTLSENYKFRPGLDVVVVGSPGFGDNKVLENAVSRGVLSSVTTIEGEEYHQVSISINSGNSGGPVLDNQGKVIGVVTLKASTKEGLAFAIPVRQLIDSLGRGRALTADEVAQQARAHRLRFVATKTWGLAEFYRVAMVAYADSMETAIDKGLSAQTGLTIAQEAFRKVETPRQAQIEDARRELKRELETSTADRQVPESVREKLADLWANHLEFQDYVENPRGSLVTYRDKLRELTDTRKRLCDSLGVLLGITIGS